MTDSKFTKSAQGKPCQLMLEGCMPENNTVVFCHLNGAGMGMKALDIHGMYACVNCHDLIDGRKQADPPYEKEWLELQQLRAVIRTQRIMHRNGLLGCLKL